ncbi:MAG: hypothetical protein GY842_01650 [bacterium]|nr:hypothetical protein [bacterium]
MNRRWTTVLMCALCCTFFPTAWQPQVFGQATLNYGQCCSCGEDVPEWDIYCGDTCWEDLGGGYMILCCVDGLGGWCPGPDNNSSSSSHDAGEPTCEGQSALGPVWGGKGSTFLRELDLEMPTIGLGWRHTRTYYSLLDSTDSANNTEQGWLWRHDYMAEYVPDDTGNVANTDGTIVLSAYKTLGVTNVGTGSWTVDDHEALTFSHVADANAFVLEQDNGAEHWFYDFDYATTALRGKLFRVRDSYDNELVLNHSNGRLSSVVDAGGHKMTYSYVSGGVNDGKLEEVKLYATESDADSEVNANGEVEYIYATADGGADQGWTAGDLILVTVRKRMTSDFGTTASFERKTHYRYWKGTYDADTNPGTDHKIKYILLPENFDRFAASYDYDTATDAQVADYANVYTEYDSDYRVSELAQQSGGCSSCGGGGGGGPVGATSFTWTANGTTPTDYNTWNLHCVVDWENDTRTILDYNKAGKLLTRVFQDGDDEWIEHYERNDHNRLTRSFSPSACSDYDESAYGVTTRASSGLVRRFDYFGSGDYEDHLQAKFVMQGSNGAPVKLVEYDRTTPSRPHLYTSRTVYPETTGSNGLTTTYAYTFYDDMDSNGIKEMTITHPSVSAGNNGPGVSVVEKSFRDKYGRVRWTQDGEGHVTYRAYADANTNGQYATGKPIRTVTDAATTNGLASVIDATWDGTDFGFDDDDDVPFARTGSGDALNAGTSGLVKVDYLGRTRKVTDAEGMVTWYVYTNTQTHVYPAYSASTNKCELPFRINTHDQEGRVEEALAMPTAYYITTNGTSHEPIGGYSGAGQGPSVKTTYTYNLAGQLTTTKRWHDVPTIGGSTRYTHYYQTDRTYDDMGRLEYVFADVADESPQDREQITQRIYDVMGRVIETRMGVSDENHDAATSNGVPTLYTVSKTYYDDPDSDSTPEHGVGDGRTSWTLSYYGTGGSDHTDTEYRYDWRNRRCLTLPPDKPYTLVAYDNLGRATASASYESSSGLDPGDDPAATEAANRLSLSKNHFDEMGRVYQTERFMDPTDGTPGDALTTNTYYDRRSRVWATDAPNSGVHFTEYDGAVRRTATSQGTQFDSSKYTSNKPDYPDNDEGIVARTEYTYDEVGHVLTATRKELNHDDTNGMGTGDFIRSYTYNWYNSANQRTDTAHYGTNDAGGAWKDASPPTYGASAPARSDTVLVTSRTYRSSGRPKDVTDPRGIVTRHSQDDLGRTTTKTEDQGGGKLNRKTKYAYNGQGALVTITADLTTDQVTEYVYGDDANARWVTKIKYPATDTDNGKTLGQPSDETYDRLVFAYNLDGTVATRTDQNGSVLTYAYDSLRRKTSEKVTTVGTDVSTDVRAVTWALNNDGDVEYLTTHSDTTPDTSTWTDAVTQIKNTYDAAGHLTKQEQEFDGKVDGSTKAVELSYATDYTSSGNYSRLEYVEYPDGEKIWRGYTHSDTAGTFQDTINDEFSRVGQLAFGDGSIGDIMAQYDFNGMRRMVRRSHTADSGWAGNDTRADLWHDTSGTYAGLNQFGRIYDVRMEEYSGSTSIFDGRWYDYDRNGNPTHIYNRSDYSRSMDLTYDNLDRLTYVDEGFSSGGEVSSMNGLKLDYGMDLLGNLTATAGGFNQNGTTNGVLTHAVNAANEITTLDRPNPAGQPKLYYNPFTTYNFGKTRVGSWSLSSGKLNVVGLGTEGGVNRARVDSFDYFGEGTIEVKITFSSASSAAGGVTLQHTGSAFTGYAVRVDTADSVGLYEYGNGYMVGGALASASVTIDADTEYVLRVRVMQRHVDFEVLDSSYNRLGGSSWDSSSDFERGMIGLYVEGASADETTFDDYTLTRNDAGQTNPAAPRWASSAETTLASGTLTVETPTYGGKTVLDWAGDDAYIAQADIDPNGGDWAELIFRYADPDNYCAVSIDTNGPNVKLLKVVRGAESTLASTTYTLPGSWPATVKVKVTSGDAVTVWVDGVQKITYSSGLDVAAGGVALSSESAQFDNVKVGYDTSGADDVIDDYVVDEAFAGTSISPTHDYAGNLTDDGTYKYVYDAWNRLAKVTAQSDTDITLQTAKYDGLGRRVEKVVTNSGDHDGTWRYYYHGHQIVQADDGSGNLLMQVYHGTQYIDEVVGLRLPHGRAYVHQDANWNVTSMTDLAGKVLERYYYSPYGEVEVVADTYFGDYDDDGDVDSDDADDLCSNGGECACPMTASVSGDCRIFDFDCDGDLDNADENTLEDLYAGRSAAMQNRRIPSTTSSPAGNPFLHQGLAFDVEIGSYQNRARQYSPTHKRFMQRDPLGLRPAATSGRRAGMHLYSYTACNPVNRVDHAGLWPDYPPPATNPRFCDCFAKDGCSFCGDLPKCPCSQPSAGSGWGEPEEPTLHDGAAKCVRSTPAEPNGSGQQCCYDTQKKLITEGSGAGTPDRYHADEFTLGHTIFDVLPYFICPQSDYHKGRPPNNGNKCADNVVDGE